MSKNGMMPGQKPYTESQRAKLDSLLDGAVQAEEEFDLDELEENAAFRRFCEQATDSQLEAILEKEFAAQRADDYTTAKSVATGRGWTVHNGRRIA
jgi:hypothetical protein